MKKTRKNIKMKLNQLNLRRCWSPNSFCPSTHDWFWQKRIPRNIICLVSSNRTEVFRQSRRQLLLPTYLCPFREFTVLGTYSLRVKRFLWKLISLPVSDWLCEGSLIVATFVALHGSPCVSTPSSCLMLSLFLDLMSNAERCNGTDRNDEPRDGSSLSSCLICSSTDSISFCSSMPVAKPESGIVSWLRTWLSRTSFLSSNHRERFSGLPVRIITHYNLRIFHIKSSWSNLPNGIALDPSRRAVKCKVA